MEDRAGKGDAHQGLDHDGDADPVGGAPAERLVVNPISDGGRDAVPLLLPLKPNLTTCPVLGGSSVRRQEGLRPLEERAQHECLRN